MQILHCRAILCFLKNDLFTAHLKNHSLLFFLFCSKCGENTFVVVFYQSCYQKVLYPKLRSSRNCQERNELFSLDLGGDSSEDILNFWCLIFRISTFSFIFQEPINFIAGYNKYKFFQIFFLEVRYYVFKVTSLKVTEIFF